MLKGGNSSFVRRIPAKRLFKEASISTGPDWAHFFLVRLDMFGCSVLQQHYAAGGGAAKPCAFREPSGSEETVLDLQAKVKGLEDQLLERIERERALVAERAAERERTPLEGKAAENSSRRGSAPAVPLGKSNRKF